MHSSYHISQPQQSPPTQFTLDTFKMSHASTSRSSTLHSSVTRFTKRFKSDKRCYSHVAERSLAPLRGVTLLPKSLESEVSTFM